LWQFAATQGAAELPIADERLEVDETKTQFNPINS